MRTFAIIAILIICQHSYGQLFNNPVSFTTQNGLTNNTITCIQKDSSGFLWIGTHEGLNRYDGTAFMNVLSNSKNNLPSNNITKVVFIDQTRMIVGTDAGLCLLNSVSLSGKKIDLPVHPKFANTGDAIADILYKKETDEIWVSTWHGLFVLNSQGTLLKKIMAAQEDLSKGYFARYLFTDANNEIWFFSQQRLGFYYPVFAKQNIVPAENNFHGFALNDLLKDHYSLMSGRMTGREMVCVFSKAAPLGRDEVLAYYNNRTGYHFISRLPEHPKGEPRISDASPLNDSIFLLNSYFGEPMVYNIRRNEIKMAADHPLWFTSWPDGFGANIYRDENNIWAGTSKSLLQFPLKTNFFTSYPALINTLKDNRNLVSYNYGIYSNNKLWIASTGAGLFGIDTMHKSIVNFADQFTIPAYSKKIISTQVLEAGNALWLFSVYGVVQANTSTRKLTLVPAAGKDSSFDASAFFPLKDSKGNIWTTLPDGIAKYSTGDNSFINYKTVYKGGPFPLLRAGPKTEDKNGNIWMARADTLVKLNTANNQFSSLLLTKNGKSLRPVTSLASDGHDVLYMSVAGSFGIYSISTGNIELYTKQTGIISTVINEIACDNAGNAWIATEGGLVFYNKQKNKFSSFTAADGLPDDNIVSLNFADQEKKILFLGFSKTYCLFKPQDFLQEKELPANFITGMEADGEMLAVNEKQMLSYKQNNISFTYTGINYNQGQQNNYACMLEGIDQDWKYTGAERKINYINLPPGKYVFKVKTANHQGEWNEQPATLSFEITPPFWQRLWFLLLAGCALLLGIYYFLKMREDALQKENNIKLQMSELRMQALRAQMNPHFIFNSLNSIQNYILSSNTIDAAGYLSRFAKLMRRILDQSKHNFLPLGEVLETLQLYVSIEAFRFNHEFTYSFDVEQNDELLETSIPPMLLQPYVENAILHGLMPKKGDKKLLIRCKRNGNNAEIIIDDNGDGRMPTVKAGHESQGEKLTAGMMENLQQIKNNKASVEIIDKTENGIPAGTMVKFILPLN